MSVCVGLKKLHSTYDNSSNLISPSSVDLPLSPSTAPSLVHSPLKTHVFRSSSKNVRPSVRPSVRPYVHNETQCSHKPNSGIRWSMIHSRPYDFQGHPRSGSRSGDDRSPLSGLFFHKSPHRRLFLTTAIAFLRSILRCVLSSICALRYFSVLCARLR